MKKKTYNEKKRNWFLVIGAVITILMVLLIVMGYFWTPYEPNAMNGACKFQPPSLAHIMGTDNFGRDIFSRVDELKEHRLDVPQATLVADELRSAGVPIPQGILTRKELVDAIMSVANA